MIGFRSKRMRAMLEVVSVSSPLRSLDVRLPAAHGERSRPVQDEREREPVQLRLRHEAQESPWPERQPERPWVEAGHVIARQDETALARDVLAPARA